MENDFTALLLKWYDENKRDLPWRKTREPYAIWVSEIMAQQTRITAVMPYYARFMKLFPTVEALADAHTDQVLKAWEGLGYYTRAHNLQKAARKIMDEFGGQLPADEKKLKSLPGIGDYTAGAILCISFGQPHPAVDGNVLRVFARVANNPLDINLRPAREAAAAWVNEIMPGECPGMFTQALMELGALVCLPKNPSCEICPVASLCEAYETDKQRELPVKSPKKPLKYMELTILLVMNGQGQVLMRQRKGKLLNGLWEFYHLDGNISVPSIKKELKALGYTTVSVLPVGEAVHTFTHLIWNMRGYVCRVEEGFATEGYCFVEGEALETLAIPTALRFYAEKARHF